MKLGLVGSILVAVRIARRRLEDADAETLQQVDGGGGVGGASERLGGIQPRPPQQSVTSAFRRHPLEILNVVDFAVDDEPQSAVFVVILELGAADDR